MECLGAQVSASSSGGGLLEWPPVNPQRSVAADLFGLVGDWLFVAFLLLGFECFFWLRGSDPLCVCSLVGPAVE